MLIVWTCVVVICIVSAIGIWKNYPKDNVKKEIPKKEVVSVSKVKIIFVVVGKNIDFNKMAVDDIVNQIEKDSILEIKQITPELKLKPQIIKVYRVDDITCPYLKKRFGGNAAGEIVYEYNGKILIKLNDGVIKVYHGHVK